MKPITFTCAETLPLAPEDIARQILLSIWREFVSNSRGARRTLKTSNTGVNSQKPRKNGPPGAGQLTESCLELREKAILTVTILDELPLGFPGSGG
jgi:hypothetical protein